MIKSIRVIYRLDFYKCYLKIFKKPDRLLFLRIFIDRFSYKMLPLQLATNSLTSFSSSKFLIRKIKNKINLSHKKLPPMQVKNQQVPAISYGSN